MAICLAFRRFPQTLNRSKEESLRRSYPSSVLAFQEFNFGRLSWFLGPLGLLGSIGSLRFLGSLASISTCTHAEKENLFPPYGGVGNNFVCLKRQSCEIGVCIPCEP